VNVFGLSLWWFLLVVFLAGFVAACGWWLAMRILPAVFRG
jgi:hypothetical protein